jgi:DNA repair protein RecO (recombination protein O)
MKSYSIEGIVLKRKNIGEADKLLTILTRHQGKITVRAIGIRRLKSRRAGSLDLFNHILAQIVVGNSEVGTLTEVRLIQSFTNWKKYLGRINLAYQLCETVDKLLPEQESVPEIYDLLVKDLSSLSSLGQNWSDDLKSWLVEIVSALGYWPESEPFKNDIYDYISSLSKYPLSSPQMLKKLSH